MYFLLLFTQTIPKTLNPQWREQFDFHLYDEQGGYVDITVWDKDAGKKDDFMGRCSLSSHVAISVFCKAFLKPPVQYPAQITAENSIPVQI